MLITRCPYCNSTFRVRPEQLKVRQGQVRCGQCRRVFDGLRGLVDNGSTAEDVNALSSPSPSEAPTQTTSSSANPVAPTPSQASSPLPMPTPALTPVPAPAPPPAPTLAAPSPLSPPETPPVTTQSDLPAQPSQVVGEPPRQTLPETPAPFVPESTVAASAPLASLEQPAQELPSPTEVVAPQKVIDEPAAPSTGELAPATPDVRPVTEFVSIPEEPQGNESPLQEPPASSVETPAPAPADSFVNIGTPPVSIAEAAVILVAPPVAEIQPVESPSVPPGAFQTTDSLPEPDDAPAVAESPLIFPIDSPGDTEEINLEPTADAALEFDIDFNTDFIDESGTEPSVRSDQSPVQESASSPVEDMPEAPALDIPPEVQLDSETATALPEPDDEAEPLEPLPATSVDTKPTPSGVSVSTALALSRLRALTEPNQIEPEPGPSEDDISPPTIFELHEEPPPSPPRHWPWVVGIVVATLALAMQLLMHFRTEISVSLPGTRPLFTAACELLTCQVALPMKIDLIGIETSELSPDETAPGTLHLATTLRNRAAFVQHWPHLEITLTNAQEQPILRRTLTPAEYLPNASLIAKGFPRRGEQPIRLTLKTNDVAAVGYRLYVFYP